MSDTPLHPVRRVAEHSSSSTLDKAYSQLVASFSESAQDHNALADGLSAQVADALKATEKRHDEAKKRQMQYFQKLLNERDKSYGDRLKVCKRGHKFSAPGCSCRFIG